MEKLLATYRFGLLKSGKPSGSRHKFYNASSAEVLDWHKPRLGNILKLYQLALVIEKLNRCKHPTTKATSAS